MNRDEWLKRNVQGATADLLARDAAVYLRQSGSTPCAMAIQKAQGVWLEDHQGKRYIDLYGNSVHHIGYSHPRLVEALTKQLRELPFTPRRFTDEPAVLLAELLVRHWPGGAGKVLLATGGSDAIEIAMKIARAATGRYKTISFYDSYHGSGFGALSIGGRYSDRPRRLGPFLEGALHVPPFYRRASEAGGEPTDSPRWAQASLDAMRLVFERERDIAAVIAEPIRSAPHVPPASYWPEVRKLCDRFGALLVFDEIPTGLGKTGKLFTFEHVGAKPDITVLGKSLGGGVVPISAVIARAELDTAPELSIGHYTHEKNPFTARAALTTLQIILEEGLVERAAALGQHAQSRVRDISKRLPVVKQARGCGLLFAIELGEGVDAESISWRALEKGVNVRAGDGRELSVTAPLVIGKSELDDALDRIEAAIAEEVAANKARPA